MADRRKYRGEDDGRIEPTYRRESFRKSDDYDGRERDNYYRRRDNGWIWPLIALLLLLFLGWLFINAARSNNFNINQNQQNQQFQSEKKVNNFEQSLPSHSQTLPAPPPAVFVNVESKLNASSSIRIEGDNKDYGVGSTSVDANGKVLRRRMDVNAPDGIYTVGYTACGDDGKCQNGSFQFKVDRNATTGFEDLTDKDAVTIDINDDRFLPEKIIVSKGTKITWVNRGREGKKLFPGIEDTSRLYPNLSSGTIKSGDTFSFTVNVTGWFPYFAKDNGTISGEVVVR